MPVKKIYLLLLFLPCLLASAAASCGNAPPYYNSIKSVFPAVVRVVAGNSMGSGIIITADGYVLTSQHVVGTAKTVTAFLNNGSTHDASVIGTDASTDLAFVRLPPNTAGYPHAMLGDSREADDLQTGSPAIVLSYPAANEINNLMFSTGIICAFRTIESVDYIQSDATVYSGSSGGTMLNTRGEVIGIINSKYVNIKDGCSTFATAINAARALLARVEKGLPIGAQQVAAPVEVNTTIVISDIRVDNVTNSGAGISWKTSLPASSGVEIGENEFSYFYPSSQGEPQTKHNVQITGLEAKTTYRFRVVASDNVSNRVYSSIYQLTTERVECAGVGCKAPDFTLNTTAGEPVSLSSYKGRKVILVITSAGCSSCAEVMRCIQQIYDSWPRQQMEVIVVVSREKAAAVERWIKLYGIRTPVVLDPDSIVTNKYAPANMPAMYFLDGDGTIKIKKYAPLGGCGREIDALLRLY